MVNEHPFEKPSSYHYTSITNNAIISIFEGNRDFTGPFRTYLLTYLFTYLVT